MNYETQYRIEKIAGSVFVALAGIGILAALAGFVVIIWRVAISPVLPG